MAAGFIVDLGAQDRKQPEDYRREELKKRERARKKLQQKEAKELQGTNPKLALWLLNALLMIIPIHFYLRPESFWERLIVMAICLTLVFYILITTFNVFERLGKK